MLVGFRFCHGRIWDETVNIVPSIWREGKGITIIYLEEFGWKYQAVEIVFARRRILNVFLCSNRYLGT